MMGFKNVEYDNIDARKIKNQDLILFNDDGNSIQKERVEELAKQIEALVPKISNQTVCFYFGPGRIEIHALQNRFSFANSRVQLYGNLINALRYQALLG